MYKFAVLDPRPIPVAQQANERIFAEAQNGVLGVEVTVPALADRCTLGNIDPQHGFHRETYDNGGYVEGCPSTFLPGETAIEFALRQPIPKSTGWVATMLPPDGATLVTVRADLDSVGAMAVLKIRHEAELKGLDYTTFSDVQRRIQAVADADKFARGNWPGPLPLPSQEIPWPREGNSAESSPELAAMSAAVMDFKVPLTDRVSAMERWLLTGEEPEQYRAQVEVERADLIRALEAGGVKSKLAPPNGWCHRCSIRFSMTGQFPSLCPQCWFADTAALAHIAVVETTHRAATMIGYRLAPVVVALNPAFCVAGGEPHRKFTVCQYQAGYVALKAAVTELAELEPGWGGSPSIIGSPQGQGSKLTIEQVVEVIGKHLK